MAATRLAAVGAAIVQGWKKSIAALKWLARGLFGEMQWNLPPWMRWSGNHLARAGTAVKSKPKTSAASLAGLVVLAAGGLYGYQWYKHQPKPVYPQCEVNAPALTTYVDDKQKIHPLVLKCDQSVAPLEAVGKPATKGINLKPKIAGQWVWENDRKLVFTPAADWPVGQKFELSLAKQKFLASQVRLEKYDYEFKTAPFAAQIAQNQFYQDPTDPALKKLVATVHFSHSVNAEEFEKHIQLSLAKDAAFLGLSDDSTGFTVNYDKLKLNAYIHSHSLSLPREDTPMTLTVKKGIHASRGGDGTSEDLSSNITIPGRYSLRFNNFGMILADNEKLEPEQVLIFNSNAPVTDASLDKKIKAWVLPEFHPDEKMQGSRKWPFNWRSDYVDQKILAAAEPLPLNLLPSDDSQQALHSYQFKAPVGRYVYVEVAPGIVAVGGTQSAKASTETFQVRPYEASLKLLGEGSILGLGGERKIGFVSRALDAVELEVGRLLPNQLHQLLAQTGGDLTIPSEYDAWQEDRIVERFAEVRPTLGNTPGKPVYDNLDLSGYFKSDSPGQSKLGIFLVRSKGLSLNDANKKGSQDRKDYSDTDNRDGRLLLVTDLGILVKTNKDGSQNVYVQSIAKGEPVAGAKVELIGRNGLALETRTTDASGKVELPKISEQYRREKTPLMILAHYGDDLSFLPYNNYGRRLNFSRFDTGGVDTNTDPNTLSSYIFSDRGLYRPGEEVHLGNIVRTQDWKNSLEGVPLELEILDPRGMQAYRQAFSAKATGFNEFSWKPSVSAPTGTYSAMVYLVKSGYRDRMLGSTTIKVQEFEPDRLKVTASLSEQPVTGWLNPDKVRASVLAMNLFGTPATNRRVTASMTLSPTVPSFAGYADYKFYDPNKFNEGSEQALPDGKTDDQGKATFDLNLNRFAKATYRLSILARVFEPEGGRNVAAVSDLLVSSSAYLVGVKKTDADLSFITKSSKQSSQWIALNPELKGQQVDGLTLEWVQRKYVSVLMKQNDGTYRYQSRLKETLRNSQPQSLAAKGSEIALPTDEPGDFALVLRNAEGQELNRLSYSVIGQGNLSRSLERSAELQLKLNKTEYSPGDSIEVSIQAPYTGAGLITLERDKVYAHQWFKTDTTSSVQHITVPANFEGNGYVTVQFVRSLNSEEVFTSPLSYGALPFKMSLAPRTQVLTLKAPELVKPGETLDLELQAPRASQAVIYAVDEGILQVARYKTPDPLSFFFQKSRLEVDSSQILDLILPEFSQLLKASAPGGDGDGALGRNLNPFKNKRKAPAVYWSGLVDVSPSGTKVSYKVPDYFNGKLHLYAVSVDHDSIGVTEGGAEVRGDLIITPNVPVMLAPGDEVDVSFGLANNLKASSGKVDITLKTSPNIEVVGDAKQSLDIAAGKEGQGSFHIRAKDTPGAASLVFIASTGAAKAQLEEGLSVRPAAPFRTAISTGRTESDKKQLLLTRKLYDPFRTVNVTAAYTPLAWASGLQQYLNDYPYSCTEQLVSMGLPALLFSQHPDLGQIKGKGSVAGVIQTLQSRQNEEGAFGLWSASTVVANWPSLWAMQYMIEARERNQQVPNELFSRSQQWLNRMAQPWGNSMDDMRQRAYAIYLLSRLGVQTGSQLSGLQQELKARYEKEWPTDITAAYVAASQRLLQQTDLAQKTLKAVPWKNTLYDSDGYYNALSHSSQLLYLYAKHFPELLDKLPATVLDDMGQRITNKEYNSLSSAYLLLALTQYGEVATSQAKLPVKLSSILANDSLQALAASAGLLQKADIPQNIKGVQLNQDTKLPLFYSMVESGFDQQSASLPEVKQGLEIQREYLDVTGKPLEQIKVGEEFLVRLRLRTVDKSFLSQVAVVDLLPGGVEPVINRVVLPTPERANPQNEEPAASEGDENLEGEGAEGEAEGDESANVAEPEPAAADAAPAVNYIPGFSGEPGQSTWQAAFADLRDDRVVVYGHLTKDMVTFTYRVRATNTGSYQTPAAYAEAMYEPNLFARSLASKFKVVKP
ncbi:alpha-2-macroglobulin family protein [Cellvibrio sp.]|uniref:alpha-2-macroglobulin family protein n=1 Tax=Cellvibrio sp. TaxID=1965322 RepID=UPI0039648123